MSVMDQMDEFRVSIRGHQHEREILDRLRLMAQLEQKRRSYPRWRRGWRTGMADIIEEHRRVVNEELIPDA